jgi:toxin ParE1/3/4
MATVRVEFHRFAEKDYDDAYDWYSERSAGAALRFKDPVNEAVRRIADGPGSFPRISGDYRRVRIQRFPYILVYRPRQSDEIVVVAVAHTSRRPGYWRRRRV